MAVKNLYPDEMLQISGIWLDKASKAHAFIVGLPLLNSMLGLVDDAHGQLAKAWQPAQNKRLIAISEEELRLDVRHDTIIRGTYAVLTGTAELVGGAEGDQIIAIRDHIAPDGLSSQLKSYRGEAGQAKQLEDRLTPDIRVTTDAVVIGFGSNAKSLTQYLLEWIDLGKQLGKLEDEKGEILAAQSDGSSAGETLKARNLWTRVANAMTANADLANLTVEQDAAIFGGLRDAEKKADERARNLTAANKAAAENAAAEKAAAEKAAAEKAAIEKAVAEKAAAEKAAAEKATSSGGTSAASPAAPPPAAPQAPSKGDAT
ncbi:MAG: hypothetical protein QM820_08120 [Minicystis sp.]